VLLCGVLLCVLGFMIGYELCGTWTNGSGEIRTLKEKWTPDHSKERLASALLCQNSAVSRFA
jgi:hypothetical protein